MLKPLAVMALLAPHFASTPVQLAFTYEIPPYFQGEEGEIHIHVDTYEYPAFYLYLCRQENGQTHFYTNSFRAFGRIGRQDLTIYIPPELTSLESVTIEFGIDQANPANPNATTTFLVSITKTLSPGEIYHNQEVEHDGFYVPQRKTIIYDNKDPYHVREVGEYYQFRFTEKEPNQRNRFLPIFEMILRHGSDEEGQAALSNPHAELRMLDHLDEFASFGEHLGNAYVSIPLSLNKFYDDGYSASYEITLVEECRYSRIDYRLTQEEELSFTSSYLAVPLRNYHDKDTFRYQVFFSHLSPCEDSFYLEREVSFPYRLYGPKEGSEYSLSIGSRHG